MSVLDAVILGLVQGLTEFLPVSSSGHLVLGRSLLGYEAAGGATFEVVVHLGTVLAIVTLFRGEVMRLLLALPLLLRPRRARSAWSGDATFRLLVLLGLSAVPAGLVGVLFKDDLEPLFAEPRLAAWCLLATALILFVGGRAQPGTRPVGTRAAVFMGLAQALALLPGISRSGTTITTGLALGVDREEVGRFAFLMAILPIMGASVLELRHLGGPGPSLVVLLVGLSLAFISGLGALWLLLSFVARGRLAVFAPYCALVGVLGLVF